MVERLHGLGGKVEVAGGRLVVSLPPNQLGPDHPGGRIARWLYVAEVEVVACRRGDGPIGPDKVPDRPILPSGALAP
jgi:hypothetical protein